MTDIELLSISMRYAHGYDTVKRLHDVMPTDRMNEKDICALLSAPYPIDSIIDWLAAGANKKTQKQGFCVKSGADIVYLARMDKRGGI